MSETVIRSGNCLMKAHGNSVTITGGTTRLNVDRRFTLKLTLETAKPDFQADEEDTRNTRLVRHPVHRLDSAQHYLSLIHI